MRSSKFKLISNYSIYNNKLFDDRFDLVESVDLDETQLKTIPYENIK